MKLKIIKPNLTNNMKCGELNVPQDHETDTLIVENELPVICCQITVTLILSFLF
jgi:hypothetical protein